MSNFKVVVRVRPLSDTETSKFPQPAIELADDSSIIVHNAKLEKRKSGLADSRCRKKRFHFDRIYWSVDPRHRLYASQKTVYDDLSPDLIEHVFAGYNVCLFAYGQTGSGKTYTMMGSEDDPGFVPRLCEGIFDKTSEHLVEERATGENVSFNISASYMEIYNEKVYDLLEPLKGQHPLTRRHGNGHNQRYSRYLQHNRHHHHHLHHHHHHHHHQSHQYLHDVQKHLRVREHPKTGPYVEGLSQHTVKDNLSLQKLIRRGNLFRRTASTRAHTSSSRSHAIFSITFAQAKLDAEHPMERRSKINLVDLAGSERADSSSEVDKLRMKEGSDINKSLATLGSVIQALAQRSLLLTWSIPSFSPAPPSSKSPSPLPHRYRSNGSINRASSVGPHHNNSNNGSGQDAGKHRHVHIPYRDSTLTWILKDSLEGNAVSVMIAAISPSSCSYFETINTLYYGQRAKTIVNKPVVNEDPVTKLICDLKAEIRRLKSLLSDQQTRPALDVQSRPSTTASFCQVDKSLSPCQMTSTSDCDLSEQLKLDEVKVDVLTRDFLEKWRRMEDSDVEVNPLSSSAVEIFTNVPHLVSLQGKAGGGGGDDDDDDDDDDDYDDDAAVGIRIFKLHVGDTTIDLSEMTDSRGHSHDDEEDDDEDDGDGSVKHLRRHGDPDGRRPCVFRNRNNVITIFPPRVRAPPARSSSSTTSSPLPGCPPPLPGCPPPPSSSPPPLKSRCHASSPVPSSSSSSTPSKSFKVYVNDSLVTGPYMPKQGDVIRFGRRLKFKFVNPYMTPRKTKRRRRSLVTSHKSHPDLEYGLLPPPSGSVLRCNSLASIPLRSGLARGDLDLSADLERRGDVGFSERPNAGDRSCMSDVSFGRGLEDGDLTPTLSPTTWPSFHGNLEGSFAEEGEDERGSIGDRINQGEENSQFRSEMELQISALEKAWSLCLEKEAELRATHESNKRDIDRRLAGLRAREEALKSRPTAGGLGSPRSEAKEAVESDSDGFRQFPDLRRAVEEQLEFERQAIARLERDYRERDERMCEEVGLMHQQIEMLKAQLESLTAKPSKSSSYSSVASSFSRDDHVSRRFFLQQMYSITDPFQGSTSSCLYPSFSLGSQLEFNSAFDLRSGQPSRLSKSLDSVSAVSCNDSLERKHSSVETVDSYASLVPAPNPSGLESASARNIPTGENLESSEPAAEQESLGRDYSKQPSSGSTSEVVDSDPKLEYVKRLSPVGSEYENLSESFSDLPLTESPKYLFPLEVNTSGSFISATVYPALVRPVSDASAQSPEKTPLRADSDFGTHGKRSAPNDANENDSDFSDFSTDSLDHHKKRPTIRAAVPLQISSLRQEEKGERVPSKTDPEGSTSPAFPGQGTDSKGDSGADCSSNSSSTGDGNGGKDEEEEAEFDLERTLSAADAGFMGAFAGAPAGEGEGAGDDSNDGRKKEEEEEEEKEEGEEQEVKAASGSAEEKDQHDCCKSLEVEDSFLEKFVQVSASTNDLSDWESLIDRMSLPGMPLRSTKALEKSRRKSNSTSSLKIAGKSKKYNQSTGSTSFESTVALYTSQAAREASTEFSNGGVTDEKSQKTPLDSSVEQTANDSGDKMIHFNEQSNLSSYFSTFESDKMFLSELDAELKRLEEVAAEKDREDKIKYVLRGNRLISAAKDHLKTSTGNSEWDMGPSVVTKKPYQNEPASLAVSIDSRNLKRNVIEMAEEMVSSIFKSLNLGGIELGLKNNHRKIEHPREFTCSMTGKTEFPSLAATNQPMDSPSGGSNSGKHVRFLLDDSTTRPRIQTYDEDQDEFVDGLHDYDKRSSISLESLYDPSGKNHETPFQSNDNSLNFKRRSENDITGGRNLPDLSDFELGKDGRMRMKKHRKRPNLMDVDFAHRQSFHADFAGNRGTNRDAHKYYRIERSYDSISRNSTASNDSGVASYLNDSPMDIASPQLAGSNLLQKDRLDESSAAIDRSFAIRNAESESAIPSSVSNVDGKESCVDAERNPFRFYNGGSDQLDEHQCSEAMVTDDCGRYDHTDNSKSTGSSRSCDDTSETDVAHLSDVGSVSASCDDTDPGDGESLLDFKFDDCNESAHRDDKDDIYRTILLYRSAVARAEELIADKYTPRKNASPPNRESPGRSAPAKDAGIVRSALTPEMTLQKPISGDQKSSSDSLLAGRNASDRRETKPGVNKGVSCDLAELQFGISTDSEDRGSFYDKTEVLGFDLYPPVDCFYPYPPDQVPKSINLVMGKRSFLRYPSQGSQDKEVEYFGLQPIREHAETDFIVREFTDTGEMATLVEEPCNSKLSNLVRCSYSIEIKQNAVPVINEKEDEEDLLKIKKDFFDKPELVRVEAEENKSVLGQSSDSKASETAISTGSFSLSSHHQKPSHDEFDKTHFGLKVDHSTFASTETRKSEMYGAPDLSRVFLADQEGFESGKISKPLERAEILMSSKPGSSADRDSKASKTATSDKQLRTGSVTLSPDQKASYDEPQQTYFGFDVDQSSYDFSHRSNVLESEFASTETRKSEMYVTPYSSLANHEDLKSAKISKPLEKAEILMASKPGRSADRNTKAFEAETSTGSFSLSSYHQKAPYDGLDKTHFGLKVDQSTCDVSHKSDVLESEFVSTEIRKSEMYRAADSSRVFLADQEDFKSDKISRPLERAEILLAPKPDSTATSSHAVVPVTKIGGEVYGRSDISDVTYSHWLGISHAPITATRELANDSSRLILFESGTHEKSDQDVSVPSLTTPELDKPRYVSQLSVFLDSSVNHSAGKTVSDVKLGAVSRSEESLSSPRVTSLQRAQSVFANEKPFQKTSNLAAMTNLSKSDEDLLGEDKALFEGLMPTYKELPTSLGASGLNAGLTDRLLSTAIGQNASGEFYTDRNDYSKSSYDVLNNFPGNMSKDTFANMNRETGPRPPSDRKHSSSLDDLRPLEREPERQGTYDSIDSITLVLVDPGVDEVCGAETRQYLNGHSSLKNVSRYGVGIRSIVGSGNSDSDAESRSSDDEESTIEAPAGEREAVSDEDEFESSGEVDGGATDPGALLGFSARQDGGSASRVNCYVLSSDTACSVQGVGHDAISDGIDYGYLLERTFLPYEEDGEISLKDFSHILASSARVENDSRTMKLGDDFLKSFGELSSPMLGVKEGRDVGSERSDKPSKTDYVRGRLAISSISAADSRNEPRNVYYDRFSEEKDSIERRLEHRAATSQNEEIFLNYKRTIETQTYPEMRVIETQTSPVFDNTISDNRSDSNSTKPTKDVIHNIHSILNDLGKSGWSGDVLRPDSLRSSELKDHSFSTETRQASGSDASYPIFTNKISELVTDFGFSDVYRQAALPGESSKTTGDEDSTNEDTSSRSRTLTSPRKFREKSKSPTSARRSALEGVAFPHSYVDRVRMSTSMADVRTCIEDEFAEPLLPLGDEAVGPGASRLQTRRSVQTKSRSQREPEAEMTSTPGPYPRGPKREKSSTKNVAYSTSRNRRSDAKVHGFAGSPIHDSGLEDRYTNTPLWLSDRGSASPGAFGAHRGTRSVRDAGTNTDETNRLHRKAQSLSRLADGSTPSRYRRDNLKREINRLRREKRRMIEMLAREVVPSKVQIELSEAQLNYQLGKTDLYLSLLEESTFVDDAEGGHQCRSIEHFLEDDSRQEDIFDYPSIRFDPEFLSRHCRRLEVSRKRIEERLSNLERGRFGSVRVGGSSDYLSNDPAVVHSSGKTREAGREWKPFVTTSSPRVDSRGVSSRDETFQSHCASSRISPHPQDAGSASHRFDKRLFGKHRTDSLHFDRTSDAEESGPYSTGTTLQRDYAQSLDRSMTGLYDFGTSGRQFPEMGRRKSVHDGSPTRRHGYLRDDLERSARTAHKVSSQSRGSASFRPLARHEDRSCGVSSQEEDDASFKLLADCYEARARARDEIRKSYEVLNCDTY